MRDLNYDYATLMPGTCGTACLPVILRPLSMRCRAKKSTSADPRYAALY